MKTFKIILDIAAKIIIGILFFIGIPVLSLWLVSLIDYEPDLEFCLLIAGIMLLIIMSRQNTNE